MFNCTLKSSKLLGLFGPADCPYWSHQYLKAIFLRVRHLRKNRPNPLPTKKVDSDAEKIFDLRDTLNQDLGRRSHHRIQY